MLAGPGPAHVRPMDFTGRPMKGMVFVEPGGLHRHMPGEPRTGRGRASRERIVEHAAELFAERGVAGTSLDEVLAAAGAGKGQLYHYFRGRDELVEAAVGYRCAQVLAGLTQALGSVASLAELERALAGFVAGNDAVDPVVADQLPQLLVGAQDVPRISWR